MALADNVDALAARVATEVKGKITGLNGATGLWIGTQAEYDALTPDPGVAYVIVDGA